MKKNNIERAERKDGSYYEFTVQDGYNMLNAEEFELQR